MSNKNLPYHVGPFNYGLLGHVRTFNPRRVHDFLLRLFAVKG